MNEIAKLAEQAAGQNDRYLFLLTLSLMGVGVFFSVKWLVGMLEKQTVLLEGLFKEANEARSKCGEHIAVNTETIKECRDAFRENTEFIRRLKEE